jgi:hypothetical protein
MQWMRNCAIAAVFVSSIGAWAQDQEKPKNLQYFPKDISRKELIGIMRQFSFATGLRCEGCHVQKADGKMDFASDGKDEKRTARVMLKMVDDINKSYIDKLGQANAIQVQCVTCHRALSKPQPINAVLAETIEKKDVNAAIAQYKDLRTKYYGSARYDFSETPLNQLSESLMAKDKNKDAVAITEMNAELNAPVSGWTQHVLAQAHIANGDKDKAKADLKTILSAHPDDKWAKEQSEKLQGGQ